MTKAAQSILQQALRLNPVERAQLIELLFHSFDKARDSQVDARWAEEAESRIDAYDAGKIKANTVDAVFKRINKR